MTFLLSIRILQPHILYISTLPVFYIYHFFWFQFYFLFLNIFIHFISIPSLCFAEWYLYTLTFLPSSSVLKYVSSSFSLLVLNSIGYSFISDFKPSHSWDFLIYGILSIIWEFAWGLLSYFERLGYSVHLLCEISLIAFPSTWGIIWFFIFIMTFLHQIQSNSCEDFLNVFSCEGTEEMSWWLSQSQSLGFPLLW